MTMRSGFALTLALGLVLGGCASGGGGAASTEPAAPGASGNLLAQGTRPRQTDNTDAAEEALEEAEGLAALGNEAASQAQYQLAAQASQAAMTEDPTNPLAHRLAGQAALGLRDYQAAALHFDHAVERRPVYEIEISPFREEAYITLFSEASPSLQSGAYLEAAAVLENANTIYPNRAEAIILLAQIYAQERQHDQALESIEEALAFLASDRMADVDSATSAGWREDGANLPLIRAQVLADAGRFEEAVGAYREIAAADPGNVGAVQEMAAILMTMGREDEAVTVYDQLLSRPGLTAPDYYRVGVGFYNAADYGRAADAFGRGVGVSPRDRDGLEMWARSLQLDSAYAAVPAVANRWIELDPASQNAIAILAQATNYGGNPQGAAEAMRRVEALFVIVDDLEMRGTGGNVVTVAGSVANRNINAGDRVTLTFTFYSASGQALGTATTQATVQETGAKTLFQVDFESTQPVVGYGYTIVRG
ncbi:MAG: tetratricopeptide repeat protein [Longimicrobiales bacterium]